MERGLEAWTGLDPKTTERPWSQTGWDPPCCFDPQTAMRVEADYNEDMLHTVLGLGERGVPLVGAVDSDEGVAHETS